MEILSGHLAYAEILLAIFLPVALISFLSPISKYRRYHPLIISIAVVAPVYIIWDQLAVIFGTWKFDSANVIGIYFFHLPIEEVSFFLVVPFSTLLIYEVISSHLKGKISGRIILTVSSVSIILLILLGVLNISRSYTSIASFFAAASIVIGLLLDRQLMERKSLWVYMAISYIPFVFFDHLMVSIPVFTYGANAIIGLRIAEIPVEEFLYVFSLLMSYVIVYDLSARLLFSRGNARP